MEIGVAEILLGVIGSGAGIWKIWTIIENNRKDLKSKSLDIESKKTGDLTEIKKLEISETYKQENDFKENVVYKIFEQYIKQSDSMFELFSTEIKQVINSLEENNKLNKDIYSQLEILRRDIKYYEKDNLSKLNKIEGYLQGSKIDIETLTKIIKG